MDDVRDNLHLVSDRARALCLVCMAGLALATASCDDEGPEGPPPEPMPKTGLLVLGIDGMDYTLTKRYMREGKLPNFQKLADMGAFGPLATTDPPQSPVAWSTFITGLDPDGHGIYDFVHRDPDTMSPYLSTSKAEEPDCTVELGDLSIGYCEAEVRSLRVGSVFWEPLEDQRIPATIYKVPANFPPHEHWHSETLSGMGTPDILGTYGTFQVLTDDPEWKDKSVSGGEIHMLDIDGQYARAAIVGPPDPYTVDNPLLTEDVELVVDAERGVALVRIEDAEIILTPGEWTDWVPFAYDVRLIFDDVPAMVRFYLKSLDPITVYVSPANLDPMNPVMPISSPRDFATLLAEQAGRYYTQGMPEDTKALAADVLSDAEFLQQADSVFEERLRLLDSALDRHEKRGGVTFFYFSSIDQVSHVFWRTLDVPEDHELAEYRDTIPELYERMDAVLGDVLERLPEGHELLILSDHGFAPYDYKVHLNTWLYQRGYLALHEGDSKGEGPLGHIDWSRTQAYALGLNQLFINTAGREPLGHVDPEEREILLRRLERELKSWRDPERGRLVVGSTSRPDPETFPGRTPDMIVGYNRGYRSSDTSAMGLVGDRTITVNNDKWSGDHCMDPRQVPGILFSTVPLSFDPQPGLADLPPTILSYFDISPDESLVGRSLWIGEDADASDTDTAPR